MTSRRSALRAILAAPFAAKAVSASAAKEVLLSGRALDAVGYGQVRHSEICDAKPYRPDPTEWFADRLRSQLYDRLSDLEHEEHVLRSMSGGMPPGLKAMKSWSEEFRQSQAVRDTLAAQRETQALRRAINEAGPRTLIRAAKHMGIDVRSIWTRVKDDWLNVGRPADASEGRDAATTGGW